MDDLPRRGIRSLAGVWCARTLHDNSGEAAIGPATTLAATARFKNMRRCVVLPRIFLVILIPSQEVVGCEVQSSKIVNGS